MTAEQLHDALTLLPEDLVLATDRLRQTPKTRIIQWKRLMPAAACLAVILSAALVLSDLPDMMAGGAKSGALAEAPAAAAPASPMEMEAALQEAPAADVEAPEQNHASTDAKPAAPDHRHGFAEKSTAETEASGGWCGNTQAWVWLDAEKYTLAGSDAIVLTEILQNLAYDPNALCRCMAEFTVDTELMTGIEVSLTNAFARCDLGQASLTKQQVEIIQDILNGLK